MKINVKQIEKEINRLKIQIEKNENSINLLKEENISKKKRIDELVKTQNDISVLEKRLSILFDSDSAENKVTDNPEE